ncbi:hypothetical protein, partial [Flavihumibacter sp. CACIAM 22H1]|uniref:hypothetical protein n=1 Tax=Flavihumibacter sp. CACIAM 22H1 TaxID=1812911 RepID=UPI0025BA63BD
MLKLTNHIRTYSILAIAALIIISSFIVFYLGYQEQIEINKQIYQEEEQKERLHLIQASISRAGIDLRDFILFGQAASMEKSLAEMNKADSLSSILSPVSTRETSIQKLGFLLKEGTGRIKRIDSTYQKHGQAAAAAILQEHGMRLFRQDINSVLQRLKADSASQFEHLLHTVKIIRLRNIIGFLLLFVVSFLILLMLWLYFRTTEKRLAKKRARLQEIVERQEQSEQLLQGGYFEWYPDQKKLLCSNGFYALFDWPAGKDVPHLNWVLDRVIDPQDREIIRSWMQEVRPAKRISRQVRIQTAKGHEKIIQIEGYPSKAPV